MTNGEEPKNKESMKPSREQDHSTILTLSAAPKLHCGYATFSKRKKL